MAPRPKDPADIPADLVPLLRRWNLTPDGEAFQSYTRSLLLPVLVPGPDGQELPAMLKLPGSPGEKAGASVMAWWDGAGAARVLARDAESGALVLERATGARSLLALYEDGRDEEASRVIARVALRLHSRGSRAGSGLPSLDDWFASLWPAAERLGGVLGACAAFARYLLAAPQDATLLHGDLHHENVLDFGPERGWLAIDPKGVIGESCFELAPHLIDRDAAEPPSEELLRRQLRAAAAEAGHDPARLARWTLAWAGLSAVWCEEDGLSPDATLGVAAMLAASLDDGQLGRLTTRH